MLVRFRRLLAPYLTGIGKTSLSVALIFIVFLGLIQVFMHILYTSSIKRPDPTTLARLDQDISNPNLVSFIKLAHKKHKVDRKEVYFRTASLRTDVKEENKKQKRLLEKLISLNQKATILHIQIEASGEFLQVFLDRLTEMIHTNSTVIVVLVLENYHTETESIIRNFESKSTSVIFVNPYCRHLHPLWFPGDETSPECISLNMTSTSISSPDCTNQTRPYFRDAKRATKKHAWTWGANVVWEVIRKFPAFKGFVVHLDDTDLLSPDAIYILHRLHEVRLSKCRDCAISLISPWSELQVLNTSGSSPFMSDEMDYSSVHLTALRGGFLHGVSFSTTLWTALKSCVLEFCYVNDDDWRWSFANAVKKRCFPDGRALMLVPRATRLVTKRVQDSYHHKNHTIDPSSVNISSSTLSNSTGDQNNSKNKSVVQLQPDVRERRQIYKTSLQELSEALFNKEIFLFPPQLYTGNLQQELLSAMSGDTIPTDFSSVGGWESPKDQQLCHAIFLGLQIEDTPLDPFLALRVQADSVKSGKGSRSRL